MLAVVENHLRDALAKLLPAGELAVVVVGESLRITAATDSAAYREPAQASVIVREEADPLAKTLHPVLPAGHRIADIALPTGQRAIAGDDYYLDPDPAPADTPQVVRLFQLVPGAYRITTRGAEVTGYRGSRPCCVAVGIRVAVASAAEAGRGERKALAALLRTLNEFPELDEEFEPAGTGWLRLGKPVATLCAIERVGEGPGAALLLRVEIHAELLEVLTGAARLPAAVISAVVRDR